MSEWTIWGPGALAHGFRFLPMEGEIMARMETIGFQRAMLSASRLPMSAKEGELDMAQLCRNDDEAPLNVPLHPGAERFYSEKGYLKD